MSAQTDLLMPRKHRSAMTWWSRHDPSSLPQSNTDHWSKMKSKCTTFVVTQTPTGGIQLKRTPPGVTDLRELMQKGRAADAGKETYQPTQARFKYNRNGTVSRVPGDQDFDEQVATSLRENIPGNYFMTRPRTTPHHSVVCTPFNARAKEGFKYWYQERPKPTMFGRYGIGSYKTVLGLGNAPRT